MCRIIVRLFVNLGHVPMLSPTTPFLDPRVKRDAYDAGTGNGVVSCSGMAPQLRIAWRELHRPLRIGNPNA
jgi:hypothetical protein